MSTPVAPAGMGPAELAQLGSEGVVAVGLGRLVTLGRAVLTGDLAGQPLGEPQHALQLVTARRRRAGLRSFP